MVAAHSGFSYDMVRRITQCYWKCVMDMWEDGRPSYNRNLGWTLALVYADGSIQPDQLNTKRLQVRIDSPKYLKEKYRVRAFRPVYNRWRAMWLAGHQFMRI
jgi:hypothetical protein